MIDRFNHTRDPLWTVNESEDGMFVESGPKSEKLVFKNDQNFAVDFDFGFWIREDVGARLKRVAGIWEKNQDSLRSFSSRHRQ